MTPQEFRAKWLRESELMGNRGSLVSGKAICSEVLADFDAVMESESDAVLTLTEGARQSGYSADHLGRLIREGKIPNAGRPNSPRVRVGDLPRKPADLRQDPPKVHLLGASTRQVVRAVVTSD